jgi:hypothetical protein
MKKCTNSATCPYRDKNNPSICGFKEHMTEYDVCPKIKLNILWLLEQQKKNKENI